MRDAAVTSEVLGGKGVICKVSSQVDELCAQIVAGAAAVIVPEESLLFDSGESLAHCLQNQSGLVGPSDYRSLDVWP